MARRILKMIKGYEVKEILENPKEVKEFGTGAHITIESKYKGEKVIIGILK